MSLKTPLRVRFSMLATVENTGVGFLGDPVCFVGALTAPLRMIINNAGEDYTEIVMGLPEGMGYNAKNGYCSYLIADGVIDPAKVERCAVTNAVSAASQFITIETLVTDEKETGNN